MVGYESFERAALPDQSWSIRPKTISARDFSAQIICLFVFTGVPRAGTAFSGNNINFDIDTSIEVKRTVSEYHNQKRVLHSKGVRGSIKLERIPGNTTIKQTATKYN